MGLDISAQYILTDANKKFWLEAKNNSLEFGRGELEHPNFIFFCTLAVELGILFGELDVAFTYMVGDIIVEGNTDDAMDLHEFIEFGIKAIEILVDGK